MELRKTVSIVTGGGTGIGRGTAVALAEAGSRVIICGRRIDKLEETVDEYEKKRGSKDSGDIIPRVLDISKREMVTDVFTSIHEEFGKVDILVNSASINIPNRSMKEMAPDDWDKMININLTGSYNCIYTILPRMREARAGLIVNIVSIAGFRAVPASGIAYIASKYGMTGFGLGLAAEEAENNIRVTNVYPGEVNTPIIDQRPNPDPPERRATMLQPKDFGDLIVSLAGLPDRVHIPEVVAKPIWQKYS